MSASDAPLEAEHPTPAQRPPERIALRPLGNPLPLGLAGFAVGAFISSALTLRWMPKEQTAVAAVVLLAFTAPLQLLVAVLGFLGRDTSGASAQGILGATWGAFGVMLLVPGGGPTSTGVGIFWLADAFVVGLAAAGSWADGRFFAGILIVSSARYLLEGIAGVGGGSGVSTAAGIVGLVQAAMGSYAALAVLLEESRRSIVLPLVRSPAVRRALQGEEVAGLRRAAYEPGVRSKM